MRPLRLGTRRSHLARTQSGQVAHNLTQITGREVELEFVSTHGDVSRSSLTQIGGTGVFTSALREALLQGQVDFAVHSLKDLPTAPADGITLAAVPAREDPRDVLVARDGLTLAELPPGSRIGTGSPRRAAQIRALGLGLELVDIRGNVDSRLARVTEDLDAVVLAAAGLSRLGRLSEATEILDPGQMLPAAGQGALAVECRTGDAQTAELLARLDHAPTRACAAAERSVLATLEAGCTAPIGALGEYAEGEDGPELYLRAVLGNDDGTAVRRQSITGPVTDPDEVGRRLAHLLTTE